MASQCSVRYQLRMKCQQQAFLGKYIVYTQLYGFARRTEYQCGVGVVVVFASVRKLPGFSFHQNNRIEITPDGALLQVGFG